MKNNIVFKLICIIFLILALAIFRTGCQAQSMSDYSRHISAIQKSNNPHSIDFIMFMNDRLHVESVEGSINMLHLFRNKPDYSVRYRVYFTLQKYYYQIWIPQENLFFTVSTTENISLGYHLIQFLEILGDYQKSKNNFLTINQ